MSDFQDMRDGEPWYEYMERIYQGDLARFYEDFEARKVPLNSQAYLRAYSPQRHTNMLLARLVTAVNNLVVATREVR